MFSVYLMLACVVVNVWCLFECSKVGHPGEAVFSMVVAAVCALAAWLNYARVKARG